MMDNIVLKVEKVDPSPWRKLENLRPIFGFPTNCIVVLQDEKILLQGRDINGWEGLEPKNFSQIQKLVVYEEQLEFATETCKYLSNNGVSEYFLLCNIDEPLLEIAAKLTIDAVGPLLLPVLPKNLTDSEAQQSIGKPNVTDVTVVLLMTITDAEGELKCLNLLEQAIASSRWGVIVLGNTSLDKDLKTKEFSDFLEDTKNRFAPTNYLPLYCDRHRIFNYQIFNALRLSIASPLGGCRMPCESKTCGHPCRYPCHPFDLEHATVNLKCKEPCRRDTECGHGCSKTCGEKCECHVPVLVDYPCGHHESVIMPCFQRSEVRCTYAVNRRLNCGHKTMMMCSDNIDKWECHKEITAILLCGHTQIFKCFENLQTFTCAVQRLVSLPCGHQVQVPCRDYTPDCSNTIQCYWKCMQRLDCGHICEENCHPEDPYHEVNKCKSPCTRRCARGVHLCSKPHACTDPCEPCNEDYEYRLICGHAVTIKCLEPDVNENNYYCKLPCMKINPFCRHQCNKICGEDCGECEELVEKTASGCPLGHTINMKCSEKPSEKCKVEVPAVAPLGCGHPVLAPCHVAEAAIPGQVSSYCLKWCNDAFIGVGECGHFCVGTCTDCCQGRFHLRCEERCEKILICGHRCETPCPMICHPCNAACYNNCEHQRCQLECGVPCEMTCDKPCPYRCEHSACANKCSEVCNKKPCYEPCPLKLTCGHPCISFCGEICPPYCLVCSPEKILNDPFYQLTEPNRNVRFLYLPDCGHCLDSESLDRWMSIDSSDEIQPKRCPLCPTRIISFRRYSAIMHENRKLIDSIRRKFFGDEKKIDESLQRTMQLMEAYMQETKGEPLYPKYAKYILHEVKSKRHAVKDDDNYEFASMYLNKAKFLEWLAGEWIAFNRGIRQFISSVPSKHLERFRDYWVELLDIVLERSWPLHPNEMKAYHVERQRIEDAITLYKRFGNNLPAPLIHAKEGMKRFREAQNILFVFQPYDGNRRSKFVKKLRELDETLKCTIQLTHEEKEQVVAAFGMRAGRWFKCKNGHPYVITECGGAMEISNCIECGVLIGGDQHVMVPNNYLATEMDGAEEPLWPTALERPN